MSSMKVHFFKLSEYNTRTFILIVFKITSRIYSIEFKKHVVYIEKYVPKDKTFCICIPSYCIICILFHFITKYTALLTSKHVNFVSDKQKSLKIHKYLGV